LWKYTGAFVHSVGLDTKLDFEYPDPIGFEGLVAIS
jgi:hypothetical protein